MIFKISNLIFKSLNKFIYNKNLILYYKNENFNKNSILLLAIGE